MGGERRKHDIHHRQRQYLPTETLPSQTPPISPSLRAPYTGPGSSPCSSCNACLLSSDGPGSHNHTPRSAVPVGARYRTVPQMAPGGSGPDGPDRDGVEVGGTSTASLARCTAGERGGRAGFARVFPRVQRGGRPACLLVGMSALWTLFGEQGASSLLFLFFVCFCLPKTMMIVSFLVGRAAACSRTQGYKSGCGIPCSSARDVNGNEPESSLRLGVEIVGVVVVWSQPAPVVCMATSFCFLLHVSFFLSSVNSFHRLLRFGRSDSLNSLLR
ncbi:hypothetical protein GGR56DRAFT_577590 [Xylariaceae sp. FL0804]|nr:hypothetical protein GGR56DRAFT_577590 [Xylariaceae sp. FL0804]